MSSRIEDLQHMLIELSGHDLTTKVAAVGGTLVVVHLGYSYFSSPLKAFPGPLWAKFTNLWRMYDYWSCTQIESHRKLHDKYGPAVQIGPDMISLSDPELVKVVYSTRGDFVKSDFYEVADATAEGHRLENVFSTRSNQFHSRYLKPYQKFFSNTKILEKEGSTDRMVSLLCEQLDQRFVDGPNAGKTADLADWIEYGAWDLLWDMTFSQDMGFLRTGSDVDGLIHTGEMTMRYLGVVGQMSWLDRWLGKNPWCPISFATFSNVAMYCFQRIMERVSSSNEKSTEDFLDNFLAAKSENPDVVTDNEVISYLMMSVLAGADTTALVEKAIVHHVLSNPQVQEKLCAELDGAGLSFPPQYSETKELPYLSAVIKEGQRMHPVISGILERIVPARGLTLPDGRFIAPGTRVGINAWVSHRNKDVYGADADSFRPERWLRAADETEQAFAARLVRMKDGDMTFGAGSRQCVGRHLATLELHKLTSTLFSRYNISVDKSAKPFTTRWWWFTFSDHINVKLEKRA